MNDDEMKELVKKYTNIREFKPIASGTAEERIITSPLSYAPLEAAYGINFKETLEIREEKDVNIYKKLLMYEESEYQETDFTSIHHPYTFHNACEEALFLERNQLDSVEVRALPYSDLLLECAKINIRNGNFEEARTQYEKCMLWNPTSVQAALSYMKFLRKQRDFEEYDRILRQAFRYAYRWEDMDALFYAARTLILEIKEEWIDDISNEEIVKRLKEMGVAVFSNKEIAEVLLKQGKLMEGSDEAKAQECYTASYDLYPKTVTIGNYLRPGTVEEGKDRPRETWEWFVLAEDKEKMLLLSVDVIERLCITKSWEEFFRSREYRVLGKRLNEEFYEKGFTEEEKEKILKVGNGDALFFLSSEEIELLLPRKEMRVAKIKPADGDKCIHNWWADSVGKEKNRRQIVDEYGGIYEAEICICVDEVGIRPAMWVKKPFMG